MISKDSQNQAPESERRALDHLTQRLTTEMHHVPPEQVAAAVRSEHARFHDSPIRDFIPIFVERAVRRNLGGRSAGS